MGQAKRGNPAGCAIALTRDKGGVVLLDKRKKLAADLKKAASGVGLELDTTSLRFGRAVVDTDTDATLLKLTVNRDAPSAMRPRLPQAPDLPKASSTRLDSVLRTLDEALAHKLDAVR